MKRNRRRLPVPQFEFGFTPDTFNLIVETGVDGDRVARERAEADHARRMFNHPELGSKVQEWLTPRDARAEQADAPAQKIGIKIHHLLCGHLLIAAEKPIRSRNPGDVGTRANRNGNLRASLI